GSRCRPSTSCCGRGRRALPPWRGRDGRLEGRPMTALNAGLLLCLLPAAGPGAAAPIDFNRDVRPLLSGRCFACHGPDKKKGGLRLDDRDAALKQGAIVPGSAARSELIRRMLAPGRRRMPPPCAGEPLAAAGGR